MTEQNGKRPANPNERHRSINIAVAWVRANWFALLSTTVALQMCWSSFVGFARVALSRLNEPYALWWLEPLFYRSALAVHQGLPLYPPPSLEYTPPIYNPGLSLMGGALIAFVDDGYPVLRWFSFICFIGLALVIAWWTWRETRSAALAIAAVAFVTSLQASMGRWMTAINVDTPSLFFGFLGLLLVTRANVTRAHAILGGLCITLGFAFKQPVCLLAAVALIHLLATKRRCAVWFAIACGGSAMVMILALLYASDGWYGTYAFRIPFETGKRDKSFFNALFQRHTVAALAVVAAGPLFSLLGPRRLRALWLPLAGVTLLMAYAGFSKAGGDVNTLLPAYVAGAVCLPLTPIITARFRPVRLRSVTAMLLIACITVGASAAAHHKLSWFRKRGEAIVHLADRPKPPRYTYPKEAKFERRIHVLTKVLPKPVFVGGRFFGMNGPLNTHQTGLYEGTSRTRFFDLTAEVAPAFEKHRYKSLVLWSYWRNESFNRLVRRYYKKIRSLGADPVIGLRVEVWMPKKRTNP